MPHYDAANLKPCHVQAVPALLRETGHFEVAQREAVVPPVQPENDVIWFDWRLPREEVQAASGPAEGLLRIVICIVHSKSQI